MCNAALKEQVVGLAMASMPLNAPAGAIFSKFAKLTFVFLLLTQG